MVTIYVINVINNMEAGQGYGNIQKNVCQITIQQKKI